jgi:hypothetical protein
METFYCQKHNVGGTVPCSVCLSMANHPAGKGLGK